MLRLSLILALAMFFVPPAKARAGDCADLALVLAIDSSSSIDKKEFRLQLEGYASAFASDEVQQALSDAGIVDVAVVFWGDSDFRFQVLSWVRIESATASERFAASILSTHRKVVGDTDLGEGLASALDLFVRQERCASRLVVNVSGDGRASSGSKRKSGVSVEQARLRASGMGVVVNGLAVTNEEPGLVDYYRKNMIVGSGSFVMEATDFSEFKQAILLKLVREIGPMLTASLDIGTVTP